MFERPHHQRIARVLEALDAPLLRERRCLFGGGTAIALRHDEYRESVDIDFLVSENAQYRELRNALTGVDGLRAIFRPGMAPFGPTPQVRADQYGIRSWLAVDGARIKIEIVLEARITLDAAGADDLVCGVSTLAPVDMVATKLLANSDRWRDDGVFSRDLIDLAMMQPRLRLLRAGVGKAESAYGPAILRDLGKAIDRMQGDVGRLERCMHAMSMNGPRAVVWSRIRALRRVLPAVARK